jgi:hypothetical protein
MILNRLRIGLRMANCKDPMDIALRFIKQDDRVLKGLSNGTKKNKKAY